MTSDRIGRWSAPAVGAMAASSISQIPDQVLAVKRLIAEFLAVIDTAENVQAFKQVQRLV